MFNEDDDRVIRRLIKKLKLNREGVLYEADKMYGRYRDPFDIKKRDERDLYKLGKRKEEYEALKKRTNKDLSTLSPSPIAPLAENRTQIILYSTAIITALEEALGYDPIRHHNRPPPDLYIPDDKYLNEIRSLVEELKRLNDLLDAQKLRASRRQVKSLVKYFDSFLSAYAGALGKGAAALTGASIVALLYKAGVGKDILDAIWGHLKLPK
jgi:hypothetical protein